MVWILNMLIYAAYANHIARRVVTEHTGKYRTLTELQMLVKYM